MMRSLESSFVVYVQNSILSQHSFHKPYTSV